MVWRGLGGHRHGIKCSTADLRPQVAMYQIVSVNILFSVNLAFQHVKKSINYLPERCNKTREQPSAFWGLKHKRKGTLEG